jgi:carbamoyltransferase
MSTSDSALILVCDGRGCRPLDNGQEGRDTNLFETESVYRLSAGRLVELEKRYRPHYKNRFPWGSHVDSLGYAYAAVSKKIFGSSYAAGKVMALAALSEEKSEIPSPFRLDDDQAFSVNQEWLKFLAECPECIDWTSSLAADLSASVQRGVEEYAALRTQYLTRKYQCSDLLLGGGVALNCKNNGMLANSEWIRSVNIFPASGDDGLSVGAAVMALRESFGNYQPIAYTVSQGCSYDANKEFNESDIEQVARLLIEGNVLGVFQGGSEFGPRALGYRTILSSATKQEYKERLNTCIKGREPFRPFGGIVLRSKLRQLTADLLAGPNMLSAVRMTDKTRLQYPALAHADGTVRLQVVEEDGSLMHKILTAYENATGLIALINTSFNGPGEPIVETLVQARECAESVGLDYLYSKGVLEPINA